MIISQINSVIGIKKRFLNESPDFSGLFLHDCYSFLILLPHSFIKNVFNYLKKGV